MRPAAAALIGAATTLTGAGVAADRRVARTRRLGRANLDRFVPPSADRTGAVAASDGVELHYADSGPLDAAVTVVLVHGFTLDRDTFVLQQRALAEHRGGRVRVIAYDQRSHGRSGRSAPEKSTVDQLGDDLDAVLTALAPHGRIVLVGHSMGGMTIMALAERRPDLFGRDGPVAGVVLSNTSAGRLREITFGLPAILSRVHGRPADAVLRVARRREALIERARGRTTDLAWVAMRRLGCGADADPALVEYISAKQARTPLHVFMDFYPDLIQHDKSEALSHLSDTPVAVLCGTAYLVTPPAHAAEIVAALPNARLITVPGAGHLIPLEQPDALNRAVAELVDNAMPGVSQ